MEEFGILSLIPPIVAIILALTTKDVIISLVSSVAAGALVLAHFNPHGAFVIFWKDLFFTELTVNSWNGELISGRLAYSLPLQLYRELGVLR
jgi:putative uncharacterized protein PH1889